RRAELEPLARALAAALNCEAPPRRAANGQPLDACDTCRSCRQIAADGHADVHWLRPESKTRQIRAESVRALLREVHMKPHGSGWKAAVIADADRMNETAANAFLKTLEEPPAKSVLLLLTAEPDRVLETIRSRCLRLNFGGGERPAFDTAQQAWLRELAGASAKAGDDLLARYRLLGSLLKELGSLRRNIQEELTNRSPLQRYDDIEPELRERWEKELAAGIEAEYRRRRAEFLGALLWWLRDVWLCALGAAPERLTLPDLQEKSAVVAGHISPARAEANLESVQRTLRALHTNVQEALNLEVGLLRLRL
ncbi:MAG: DNA polymerase III subunit, partial [Verrucomicrobiae bacterium]|nr:DNA polymerase III subunit [Verrucomicrobiae bacterium]